MYNTFVFPSFSVLAVISIERSWPETGMRMVFRWLLKANWKCFSNPNTNWRMLRWIWRVCWQIAAIMCTSHLFKAIWNFRAKQQRCTTTGILGRSMQRNHLRRKSAQVMRTKWAISAANSARSIIWPNIWTLTMTQICHYLATKLFLVVRLSFTRKRKTFAGLAALWNGATVRLKHGRFGQLHHFIIRKATRTGTCDSHSWFITMAAEAIQSSKLICVIQATMTAIWWVNSNRETRNQKIIYFSFNRREIIIGRFSWILLVLMPLCNRQLRDVLPAVMSGIHFTRNWPIHWMWVLYATPSECEKIQKHFSSFFEFRTICTEKNVAQTIH